MRAVLHFETAVYLAFFLQSANAVVDIFQSTAVIGADFYLG